MKRNTPYFLLIVVLIGIDQASKFIIAKTIPFYGTVKVIPGFFNLSHIHNKGAIFGMFSQIGGRWISILLMTASLIALGMVIYYFFKAPAEKKWMKVTLSLILAGALGNFIDRIFRGYVIDFLEFHVKRAYWPTFNAADSCISIGAFMLVLVYLTRRH
jgi:signal peptidase II